MSELNGRGLRHHSELGFGESLSKLARHELAILCLEGLRLELSREPLSNKSRGRGRPTSAIGVLAQRMAVHYDSVRRWTNIQEVQSSDYNAERLAEIAYHYNPKKVERILSEDISRRRETMDKWLREAESNYSVNPYVENIGVKEVA